MPTQLSAWFGLHLWQVAALGLAVSMLAELRQSAARDCRRRHGHDRRRAAAEGEL